MQRALEEVGQAPLERLRDGVCVVEARLRLGSKSPSSLVRGSGREQLQGAMAIFDVTQVRLALVPTRKGLVALISLCEEFPQMAERDAAHPGVPIGAVDGDGVEQALSSVFESVLPKVSLTKIRKIEAFVSPIARLAMKLKRTVKKVDRVIPLVLSAADSPEVAEQDSLYATIADLALPL